MKLQIVATAQDARIETLEKESNGSFMYYRHRGVAGFGCQVNDEALRPAIEKFCFELSTTVMDFAASKKELEEN